MILQKIRFFSSVVLAYALTIGAIGALLYSSHLFGPPVWAVQPPAVHQHTIKPTAVTPATISGIPSRIVITAAGIDLPVDKGTYDAKSGTWTLSPTHAEFAIMTMPANNDAGTTFIYGHGTDAVFGKIGDSPPPTGTVAQLYTEDGHVFTYTLESVRNLRPTDTSILADTTSGQPRLVVQTCTGAFSQWRTMFMFAYKDVQ